MTDIEQAAALKELIESGDRILVTSHISPDPDAVSSILLLGTTLKQNFPGKQIVMALEESPTRDLSFLNEYKSLKFENLLQLLNSFKPDLLVMVDVANLSRISRTEGESIKKWLQDNQSKIAIIDHHEPIGKDNSNIYINERLPATAQQIFKLCFKELGLQRPKDYAETTLLGIITDTNRFKYQNPKHAETFRVVDELLDDGASIEKIENISERYNSEQISVLIELLKNLTAEVNYNYSFLGDEFMANWQKSSNSFDSIKGGSDLFINQFLRNYADNYWGFAIYNEYLSGENVYSARFRAIDGSQDVSLLAAKLGGGGHKGAAGAKFTAASVEEALEKVKEAISQN